MKLGCERTELWQTRDGFVEFVRPWPQRKLPKGGLCCIGQPERVLFSWKQFEWMGFSSLTRRTPQSDAIASVEDFDKVGAEKTPQQGVQEIERIIFFEIA